MKTPAIIAFALLACGALAQSRNDSVALQAQLVQLQLQLSQMQQPRTLVIVQPANPPIFVAGESPQQRADRIKKALEDAKELWRVQWSTQNPYKNSRAAPKMPREWEQEAIRKSDAEAQAAAQPTPTPVAQPAPPNNDAQIAALKKKIVALERQLKAAKSPVK